MSPAPLHQHPTDLDGLVLRAVADAMNVDHGRRESDEDQAGQQQAHFISGKILRPIPLLHSGSAAHDERGGNHAASILKSELRADVAPRQRPHRSRGTRSKKDHALLTSEDRVSLLFWSGVLGIVFVLPLVALAIFSVWMEG